MKLKILVALIIISALTTGFLGGIWYSDELGRYPTSGDMTTEEALVFLKHARRLHQYFVDHPDRIFYKGDSLNKQKQYVEIYTELIVLIEKLK